MRPRRVKRAVRAYWRAYPVELWWRTQLVCGHQVLTPRRPRSRPPTPQWCPRCTDERASHAQFLQGNGMRVSV